MLQWLGSARVRFIASVAVLVLGTGFLVTAWVVGPRDRDEPTAWDKLLAMAGPGGMPTLEMAKQGFALTYAPLPGVRPPSGPFGRPRYGSQVARWILTHWDQLTPQERDIVGEHLGLRNPTGNRAMRLVSHGWEPDDLDIEICGNRRAVEIRPPSEGEKDWVDKYPPTLSKVEQLIGVKLDAAVVLCFGDKGPENDFGDTVAKFDKGRLKCRITVLPLGQKLAGNERVELLAHELTHCFQSLLGKHRADSNGYVPLPDWIAEGSANWVGYSIAGGTPNLNDWSVEWLEDPETPIVARDYANYMFLEHVNDVRGDMASILKHVLGVAGEDAELTRAAYWQFMQPVGDDILDTLPSSWLMQPGRGPQIGGATPWFLEAPGVSQAGVRRDVYAVESDRPGIPATAQAYGSQLLGLSLEADVMILYSDDVVYGRFGADPDGDYELTQALGMIFCTKKGGCKCKDGSQPEVPFTNLDARFAHIAVTGGEVGTSARVFGYSIERFCKEKPKPKGAKKRPIWHAPGGGTGAPGHGGPRGGDGTGDLGDGGCTGSCGGSTGDPHLNTFDNLFYDLQSVGEYTLAQAGDLAIQARTAAVRGSTTASVNVAFAMRVGEQRVGFYLGPQGIRVSGNATKLANGSYRVDWPDGTKAWVVPLRDSLTIQISPAEARKGKLSGVLGDWDGEQRNDLKLRDGTPLTDATFADLHTRFVDSWRVSAAESLFEYGPGESTETFTDPAFPSGPVTAQTAPQRGQAEAACRAAGVTDPVQLDNCIIDVAVTGDPAYAAGAVAIQRFLAKAVGPGTTIRDGTIAGGTIASGEQKDRFPLDLGGASVFFVADWNGPSTGCDQSHSVNLVGHSHGNFPCTGGMLRFQVPDPAGRYELEITGNNAKTGRYQFQLITLKPRTLDTRPGTTVRGTLDVRGREDVYRLDTGGATRIVLRDTPVCDAGLLYELLDLTTGGIEQGARPLCGEVAVTLPRPDRRYAIGVMSDRLATGGYAFSVQPG